MSAILPEQTLIEFNAGDAKAFRQVFDYYYPGLVQFSKRLTGSREEAEEIVNEIFLGLYKRCTTIGSVDNIKAFLYISARNRCFNFLKSKKRLEEQQKLFAERMQDETSFTNEYFMTDEILKAVCDAIETLPQECKKIFKLAYYEDLKPKEIAKVLQIAVSTVYVQQSKAINTLRFKLSENTLALAWLLQTLVLLHQDIAHPTL
ncbi:MAG: RNA polymerase sigma-70 factor [Chitinophagaceae bacterium]